MALSKQRKPTEAKMFVISAMRDFADGLTRGLSLFLTERQDTTVRTLSRAVPPKPRRQA